MKICIITLIIFTPLIICLGQNLIPNPSFEKYKELPCKLNELRIQDLLEDWIQPLPSTTDYWNSQSSQDCFLRSNDTTGMPRTGNGMTGIITAATGYVGEINEIKEYLEVRLLQPLKIGQLYEVEFYVTTPKYSSFLPLDLMESNNLGIAFSVNKVFDFTSSSPLYLDIQPKLNESEIVAGKGMWGKIRGCIYADSAYQYLLIGNFHSNINTLTKRLSFNHQEAIAYYFIDDVSVVETNYNIANLQTKNIFCYYQDSIVLNAYVSGATGYSWEDGTYGPEITISKRITKDYSVTIQFNECSYIQKFNVESFQDISLGKDTVLCGGEILTLSQNYKGNNLTWWDGTIDSLKTISHTGTYWASVNNACTPSDSINVTTLNCPGFIPNVITSNKDEYNEYFKIENISNRSCIKHL